jgi:hypothetical protein
MPVEVKGALEVRKAIRKFEPDLAKELTKELGSFLKPVVKQARGFLPSNEEVPSGWLKRENAGGRWATRYYDRAEASRGITFKTSPSKANRNGFVSLASIFNKSAAGAIYETAGRKSGMNGNFTPKLGGHIKGKTRKESGRVIFRAGAEDEGKAKEHILQAIETASAKLNARSK